MSTAAADGPMWTPGDYLRKARTDGKKSVAAMAVRLGVTAKTINNYEANRTRFPYAVVEVWAQETGAEWLREVVKPTSRCILLLAVA